MPEAQNLLYYGDNLDVLRRHVKDESVDLVYLDPPFKSNQDYNVLFAEHGTRSAAQIKAFEDTWRWDEAAAAAYEETVEAGGDVAQAMRAFRTFLGTSDMLAYLSMMAPRLVELRRVLKPGGSLYLHCDPTASHYLKLLLDAIFAPTSFQNEIVWSYRRWPSPSRHYQRMHDILLFYAKGSAPATFNVEYEENSPSYQKRFGGKTQMLDPETRTRKITLDTDSKGLPQRDVWDISIIAGSAKERLGYPTQKPEALLERVIKTSSNEGDLVLDSFCGCGTTIAVAQRLERRWIGIDITHLAINLIRHRLRDAYGDKIEETYRVIGEPVTLDEAKELAKEDPYQFQWWALGLVGARPTEQKKGADKGIDGRIYFHDEGAGGKTKQIVLSVKAGNVGVAHVRDLRGVMEREQAELGVLLTMQEPTQPMRTEAAGAGYYTSPGWNSKHPRVQILTVAQLLDGKQIDYPHMTSKTFKKAPKAQLDAPDQMMLGSDLSRRPAPDERCARLRRPGLLPAGPVQRQHAAGRGRGGVLAPFAHEAVARTHLFGAAR
jgi:DNA modification methylase